jgi:hypothetical protein
VYNVLSYTYVHLLVQTRFRIHHEDSNVTATYDFSEVRHKKTGTEIGQRVYVIYLLAGLRSSSQLS